MCVPWMRNAGQERQPWSFSSGAHQTSVVPTVISWRKLSRPCLAVCLSAIYNVYIFVSAQWILSIQMIWLDVLAENSWSVTWQDTHPGLAHNSQPAVGQILVDIFSCRHFTTWQYCDDLVRLTYSLFSEGFFALRNAISDLSCKFWRREFSVNIIVLPWWKWCLQPTSGGKAKFQIGYYPILADSSIAIFPIFAHISFGAVFCSWKVRFKLYLFRTNALRIGNVSGSILDGLLSQQNARKISSSTTIQRFNLFNKYWPYPPKHPLNKYNSTESPLHTPG